MNWEQVTFNRLIGLYSDSFSENGDDNHTTIFFRREILHRLSDSYHRAYTLASALDWVHAGSYIYSIRATAMWLNKINCHDALYMGIFYGDYPIYCAPDGRRFYCRPVKNSTYRRVYLK